MIEDILMSDIFLKYSKPSNKNSSNLIELDLPYCPGRLLPILLSFLTVEIDETELLIYNSQFSHNRDLGIIYDGLCFM